jgi:hypothetical protein
VQCIPQCIPMLSFGYASVRLSRRLLCSTAWLPQSQITHPVLLLLLCCCCRLLQQFPWLTAARAASLAPGCAGVLAVMRCLGVQGVLVSDCDLLDGVMRQLRQKQQA